MYVRENIYYYHKHESSIVTCLKSIRIMDSGDQLFFFALSDINILKSFKRPLNICGSWTHVGSFKRFTFVIKYR